MEVHGKGAFVSLHIPELAERNREHERWLPATAIHPGAKEPFRRPVTDGNPSYADLGVWNIFANPDRPSPQQKLAALFCVQKGRDERLKAASPGDACQPAALLKRTIGAFKTPGLRDLGHSEPYFHNGAFSTLESVMASYRQSADLARSGHLRNPDPALAQIRINGDNEQALVRFLEALNEDYE